MTTITPTATDPVWTSTAKVPHAPRLLSDQRADVCIVGAGIAGLTTAYCLAEAGKSVIVLDQAEIGAGETGLTSAHLSVALDMSYRDLDAMHGERASRLVADSHSHAIDKIEQIAQREGISCDFERLDGYLLGAPGRDPALVDAELQAVWRAGLSDVERLPHSPIPSFDNGPCLRFPRQAQFHPLKYLAGLATAIEKRGGHIFSSAHAVEIAGGPQAHVKTDTGHTVTATVVIVTTYTPVNDYVTMHTKQAAYRSYVIGVPVAGGSILPGLYWDSCDPYHYVRLFSRKGEQDLLIIGGEDHKTGQGDPDLCFARLMDWAGERFPIADEAAYAWSGQIMEPVDGLAYIGHNPGDERNVYISTGHSGNGMTYGTITGMLLTDLILGRPNPWSEVYDPKRITLRATPEFLRENLNVAAQYGQYLTPAEMATPEKLARGEGAIVRRGISKVAVYHDDQGVFHEFSAMCPHLSCVVQWNTVEKTWDCPCHGSRFTATGEVRNGPAITGLRPAESRPKTEYDPPLT